MFNNVKYDAKLLSQIFDRDRKIAWLFNEMTKPQEKKITIVFHRKTY